MLVVSYTKAKWLDVGTANHLTLSQALVLLIKQSRGKVSAKKIALLLCVGESTS